MRISLIKCYEISSYFINLHVCSIINDIKKIFIIIAFIKLTNNQLLLILILSPINIQILRKNKVV